MRSMTQPATAASTRRPPIATTAGLAAFPGPDPALYRSLRPYLLYPAWAACLVLLVGQALVPALLARIQYVPFLASLVLFGLPHGAVDHLIPFRLARRRLRLRGVLTVAALYLALALLYLGVWMVQPLPALAFFLFLSVLHWGQGDAFFLIAFLGRSRPANSGALALIWAVRGGLPILLPALVRPGDVAGVSRGILSQYGWPGAWHISASLRAAGLALLALLVLAYSIQALADHRKRRYQVGIDLFEIALLCVLAWRVLPMLAIGVYFCLWHSWRHIGRLLLANEANLADLARRRFGIPLRGLAIDATPTTLAALCLLGGLYWLHRTTVHTPEGLVSIYLSLIAALTLPHALVVLWMDARQGTLPSHAGGSHRTAARAARCSGSR